MKIDTNTITNILSGLRDYFKEDTPSRMNDGEDPFRSELYNSGQMARHAAVVARAHRLLKVNGPDQLLKRLDRNRTALLEVRNLLVERVRTASIIAPSAEWLLDNFYLIEEQIAIARKHLPKGYSEALPNLAEGRSAGMPRVYDIVLEIIAHSDGRVDGKSLGSFIASYQTVSPLSLGELWAIPIMLRLAVIENLRRIAGNLTLDIINDNLSEHWTEKMMKTVKDEPGNLILVIADMARSKPDLNSSFVAGFCRQLQGKGPAFALPLGWMEQQLTDAGLNSNDLVRYENQKQATDQVSVRNSIGTLRFIGATDWREFVEEHSHVEQVLRRDVSGIYPRMDFATRDRYRHVVEAIAKASSLSEPEVAQKALDLSASIKDDPKTKRQKHIGYYLVDKGLSETETAAAMRRTNRHKLVRLAAAKKVTLYLVSIFLLSSVSAAGMCYLAWSYGITDRLFLVFVGFLSFLCASQLAVPLINWLATIWVHPRLLPRMDFSEGIPAQYRTLVVIPTMLSNKDYIEELAEALEIRFLANKEASLHFGLLTDFTDANAEHMPEDSVLLELTAQKISELNRKYKDEGRDVFYLFHRPRIWNPQELKWMGYERKRGKLAALNALLREGESDAFSLIMGHREVLTGMKYVITLDSDTQLPRDAAWKFIATMAHPLNQAVFDPHLKRVVEGYGILQPRVAAAMPRTAPSRYMQMQGSVAGIDPYTKVSSDVYQDVFDEGSFIGKGIYDVDIFEASVGQVFEENRVLSHDLLEGCYARAGLLSDVLLYEENPAQYEADIRRHHRWIRGDWQIGAWMMPFVTTASRRMVENKLSLLSRWKIFDNLRRSLLPVCLLLLLLLGWTILPVPWFWTLAVTIIILLPALSASAWQLLNKPQDLTLLAHTSEVAQSVKATLIRFVFGLAVLPFEAYRYTDAIIRTNWRLLVTRRRLLEWTTSASVSTRPVTTIAGAYKSMWVTPLLSLVVTTSLLYLHPLTLYVAAPFLMLWMAAPVITWYLGQPEPERTAELSATETLFLHRTARKTWSYFEEFVTKEENWLPPDNFQEQPVAIVAHRTSPTNMGLALLANLTAYDFGYITGVALRTRTYETMQSMLQLERYKGHFFNWYDTLSLIPLNPRYVSAVDSGNLCGHLLVLRQALLGQADQPILRKQEFDGLLTTARIVNEKEGKVPPAVMERMLGLLSTASVNMPGLSDVKRLLEDLSVLVYSLKEPGGDETPESENWVQRLAAQLDQMKGDLGLLAPWTVLAPVPQRFGWLDLPDTVPSLRDLVVLEERLLPDIDSRTGEDYTVGDAEWLQQMRSLIVSAAAIAREAIYLMEELALHCEELSTVEYDFLVERSTSLLRIGYNVDEDRPDNSFYDLLASEARLGIFVGIAQGKLPQESWFSLGRLLTHSGGDPILVSWSGSMFEYLMPQLVMPLFENTLLHQTSKASVKRQIDYATQRGVPWGISESAYNRVDASLNYQYRAFGVPGLGLKRGLEEDLVIAPYATMMALMVMPDRAVENLRRMAEEGFEGAFGFYEAIDYTASRLPRGITNSVIKSYMVHHQGMGLLSLAYQLLDKPMQARFESELRFQATLLLLQERVPRSTHFYAHTADLVETHAVQEQIQVRNITTPHTAIPEVHMLSNGSYQVMITNSGGGFSRWKDIAITRWREDATKDDRGIFCYIKDTESGSFWSNTYQPAQQSPVGYQAVFSQGHAEFRRQDFGIDTKTEIVISPEDDTEMRRLRITNSSPSVRVLEITSYAEIVMASQASDEAHPAFSNLFVQTEILPELRSILATRRARFKEEAPPWMFHLMDIRGAVIDAASYETDRMTFIGRGHTLSHPQAMDTDMLSGKQGAVLDPVMAIRYRITLKPHQTATVDLIYGVTETREGCEALILKYRDQHLKNRAFELSWTHSQVLLRQINATESDAQLYGLLAASIIYNNPVLRVKPAVIQTNYRGQSGLWSHSVSGDLPIVLLHIYNNDSMELVRQMIQAHAYWRLKGLSVDLLIWNEDYGSYRQHLQEQILGLITTEAATGFTNSKPGNVFVKSVDQISSEDRILFESVARVIISDNKGSLSEQVNRMVIEPALPPVLQPRSEPLKEIANYVVMPDTLLLFNGYGGFTTDGREYKILTDAKTVTPAPWSNVIANPEFGTVISESGSAYTWAQNAHEYRITPWNNDPVTDNGGEAFYLRDEETGRFWSPAPFPSKGLTPYITTHGFGYSVFKHIEQELASEMTVFVDKALPVKFVVLRIKNLSGKDRKCTATGFLEIILGDLRSKTNMHILSERATESGALLFRNRYSNSFADRVAFFKVDGSQQSFTTHRAEFIGRNRNLEDPQALHRERLSGRTGAGMDTCGALQVKFDLAPGDEREIIFQIGSAAHTDEAESLIRKFKETEAVMVSLKEVKVYWKHTLGAVQVTTPDQSLNILANGWLMYQTIACRLFARSGYYQSGGAFGFRDQLQDVLALLHNAPQMARDQILLNASRQFTEGDVQHWWHPPEGRGVRTRCSDDLLWLPFAVCKYLDATADQDILEQQVGFLASRTLHQGEDALYDLPVPGLTSEPLYEHCVRAVRISLQFGRHGLPLIGSGDWNDGMDRVGNEGKGESAWLAFFLYDILLRFSAVAAGRGDNEFAAVCKDEAIKLQSNIEMSAWDGQWYLRAYFDDGSPLGSRENDECRIDAIVQSWSVLSGAANPERRVTAMGSLDKYLVSRDMKLIRLLDPPFDKSNLNPGYIKGYVPGVRENGGQYSHAAIWALMAFAKLGDREKLWELYSLIQPVGHSKDAAAAEVYKVEPYVTAADVYANESHRGRGGWTWYTGSSGWMYQMLIGSLLGIELLGDKLHFMPCFPLDWPSVSIVYKYRTAVYNISIFQIEGAVSSSWKNGTLMGEGDSIRLEDDGMEHEIEIRIAVRDKEVIQAMGGSGA